MGCLYCFECCKSFKESKTEFRKEESTGCSCCEGSSSSKSSNDVARRKRGCCCFPWKKASKKEVEESRREGKGKKCFTCFKSSEEGGKGASCGSGCLCNGGSSRSRESRGCGCFSCKKLSKKEGKEHKCFSCFRTSKDEVNARNRRGDVNGCCYSCKESCEEDIEARREPDNGCFSCFSLSKKGGKERKSSCNGGCFCCGESTSKVKPSETRGHNCLSSKRSSKEDPKSRGKAKICLSCFRTSSKTDSSKREEAKKKEGRTNRCCLPCCCVGKSSEDSSLKKEGGETRFCFQCCNHKSSKEPVREETRIQQKKSLEDSTKKRGSKVMCCCAFCCTKALDERKTTSKTKCSLSCFCCVQESYQNSSMKKRKRGLTCLHIKEQSQDGNGRTSNMHNTSFTSDNHGKNRSQAEQILPLANGNSKVQVFTYKEIVAATENFNEHFLLGSGGFGKVYKGQHLGKHEVVAVKQLKGNDNHINNEFLVDVVTLSLLHHPNLIKLLGYCAERDQMILVYEYMPFGSLQNHLLDIAPNTKPLDWHTRMKIAAGAAKGLEHLHDVANPPMIYRDMKASNILLDANYNPKLSDFGLEKPTRVMGTYGCCAPEYAFTRKLTKTTDVYSFGVLLLELITGRKAIDNTRQKTEQYLAHWAAPRFKDKRKFPKMADPILNGNFPIKDLYQALAIANMCLQYEASSRPLMSDVATAIEYLVKPETDCSEYFEELQIHHQLHLSNHEKLEISGDNRLRTSTVSFDGETFQSISSDIDLREEDEEEEDCQ